MKRAITAANQFTDPMLIKGGGFSISAVDIVGTVTLQRVRQEVEPTDASDWKDVETYTDDAEKNGFDYGTHWYRIGVKTGEFTSGIGAVEISW